ncbi:MAG: exodeoxyribonuclease III [Leptospiraceae bacterium]|nr:exodeoxyribonuclease III [Leptospiraceae bacterium]MDW8305467.1 exodeoxyribonuclease III [Leptospiraceae bacterium]
MQAKIISWNVNGLRAVEKKGELKKLIDEYAPDLFFIQETKAKPEQLSPWLLENPQYETYYHSAERPGYSGTALWVKKGLIEQKEILRGMPGWRDHEGRVMGLAFKDYMLYGVYFPNGGKSPEAWREKLQFYDHFHRYIHSLRDNGKKVIFAGDLNVAHQEIDLARPKENENTIGFLPEERAWVTRLIEDNWIDVFRALYPDKVSYTWWQLQTRARERNIGWRIDYFVVDKPLLKRVKDIHHLNDHMGSDHCPILLVIDL